MAVTVLLKLAAWTGEGRYRDAAEQALGVAAPFLARYPTAFAQWLTALDFALAPVREISIVAGGDMSDIANGAGVGDRPARDPAAHDPAAPLLAVVRDGLRPHQVVAVGPPGGRDGAPPLLHDRSLVDGHPAAYVCRGFACDLPVTSADDLRRQLSVPVGPEESPLRL
jgi:uncharacterized protein YyaL (SSP411 family)